MTDKTDGGPALPVEKIISLGGGATRTERSGGMSLRDWFATAALTTGQLFDARDLGAVPDTTKFSTEAARIAGCAYAIADAMLAARKGLDRATPVSAGDQKDGGGRG